MYIADENNHKYFAHKDQWIDYQFNKWSLSRDVIVPAISYI